MYNTCLNENSSSNHNRNNNINPTTAATLMNNGLLSNDPSIFNIDPSLLETTFKEATPSNRSLTSSTTFASNQLIAAANAARSAQQQQQQQQHSLSIRTTADSNSNSRGCLSAGANSKTNVPFSTLAASASSTSYPSLLQDAARSNPIIQLLKEVAKQQSCKTCGKDKPNNNKDSQFLTPKSFDVTTSHVSFSLLIKKNIYFIFFFFKNRLETIQITMYIVMMVILFFIITLVYFISLFFL
jgi:hypothetical protein